MEETRKDEHMRVALLLKTRDNNNMVEVMAGFEAWVMLDLGSGVRSLSAHGSRDPPFQTGLKPLVQLTRTRHT